MAAIAQLPNLPSQLERAVIAYFKVQFDDLAAGIHWYHSNSSAERKAPYVQVIAASGQESTPHSRTFDCRLNIEAKVDGGNKPDSAASEAAREALDTLIGRVAACMSQTDDGGRSYKATCDLINTAGRDLADTDMQDFTAKYLEDAGFQRAAWDAGNMFIFEQRNYIVRCVSANVD